MHMKTLLSTAAVCGLLVCGPAFANPAALAVASSAASATGIGKGGAGGSATSKTGDNTAIGAALGQAATAAQNCLKGTKFLFGLLEWTDDSSKCELYGQAAIAETAAAMASDPETRNFYYIRANELLARAEGLSIPGN